MSGYEMGHDGGFGGAHHKENTMEADAYYLGRIETELKAWGKRLDQYAAAAAEATGETKAELSKHVVELKATYRAAQTRLDELRTNGKDSRDIVIHSLKRTWSEVETTIKKLMR